MSEKTIKGDWLKFHANKCFFSSDLKVYF